MATPMTSYFWDAIDPNNSASGIAGAPAAPAADVGAGKLGMIGIVPVRSVLSPQHPLFVVGVLLAATGALIGVSTHVRIGRFEASASE